MKVLTKHQYPKALYIKILNDRRFGIVFHSASPAIIHAIMKIVIKTQTALVY